MELKDPCATNTGTFIVLLYLPNDYQILRAIGSIPESFEARREAAMA